MKRTYYSRAAGSETWTIVHENGTQRHIKLVHKTAYVMGPEGGGWKELDRSEFDRWWLGHLIFAETC
jgi:hypothetical protein